MKAFTAVIWGKIREIRQLNYPIVLALTTDEETNLNCVNNMVKKLKELNIKEYKVRINTFGNVDCRNKHRDNIKNFLFKHIFCLNCLLNIPKRLEKNSDKDKPYNKIYS